MPLCACEHFQITSMASELYLAVSAPALVASDRAVSSPLSVPLALPSTETPLSGAVFPLPLHAVGVAKDFALFDQPCVFLQRYVWKKRTGATAFPRSKHGGRLDAKN